MSQLRFHLIYFSSALAVKLTTGRFIGDYSSGSGKSKSEIVFSLKGKKYLKFSEMIYRDTAKDLRNPKISSIEILDSSSEVKIIMISQKYTQNRVI